MKALGRDRRTEVEVDGVPGQIVEKRGSMSSTEGQYTLMRWRHVGTEVVVENSLRHPVWAVLCTPKILRAAGE